MPKTEGWTLRAPLNLVTQAAAVTVAKLGADRAPIDRGQLARAGLYALALGYISEARLAECVQLAELRGGWPKRDDHPERWTGPVNPEPDRRAASKRGRWVTSSSGPDYRAADE